VSISIVIVGFVAFVVIDLIYRRPGENASRLNPLETNRYLPLSVRLGLGVATVIGFSTVVVLSPASTLVTVIVIVGVAIIAVLQQFALAYMYGRRRP
jgi:hypothetical protein